MPEINASLFNGVYLDNAFPGTGSQSDASFDFGSMFGSLPGGGSPQEMFISPLENVASHNAYVSLASTNTFAQISHANSPVPASNYSGSPAPSDFSLPLHASHPHAQSQPHRVLEAVAPQAQAKSTMANLDVDMAAYTQGLANFNIPMDMGLSYVVPEMPPLSFDISEQMFANALQEHQHQPHQQQQQAHLPIAAPVAVPVDTSFAFNDIINEI
jgi:transcription factor SOX7/8/10/18 (SOX group E/F)